MLNNNQESPIFKDIHVVNTSENFTTISREYNASVLAGIIEKGRNLNKETDSLAVVVDGSPLQSQGRDGVTIKKEETERKISAWENAKIAKINNRFERDEVVIRRWEDKQVHNATSWMKGVERKLEEKRAKAVEKMKNDIVKSRKKVEERRKLEEKRAKAVEKMANDIVEAHKKAEERKSLAEAKRRTKVAKILEIANFMRAMGRAPSKYSFWK